MVETKFALVLSLIEGIGPARYKKLTSHFQTYDQFIKEATPDLIKECGIDEKSYGRILKFSDWRLIDKIFDISQRNKISIIGHGQDDYPDLLREIQNPPSVIYFQGDMSYINKPSIAVIGSRKPTDYGRMMTNKIAGDLAARGLVIISGLAWGIDAEAHHAALKAGGSTGAVFGSGLDIVYPANHRQLAEKITNSGFLLSEFSFGTKPEKYNFPRRNRIISGLSLGVVVVEAAARSGALVTANLALDQGRDVFAVPGPADSPMSEGTINLMKQGAIVATTADDILQSLGWDTGAKENSKLIKTKPVDIDLNPDEQKVCNLISREPAHVDELTRNSGIPTASIATILLKLELAGLITRKPGNYIART